MLWYFILYILLILNLLYIFISRQPIAFDFSQGLKLMKYSWFFCVVFLNIYNGRESSC